MSAFVYMWVNKIDGKKYIGSHIGTTDDGYVGSGKYFLHAINKYGLENFERTILEETTIDIVREREQYYLDFYNAATNDEFYNLSPHSAGGFFHINSNPVLKRANEDRFRTLFDHIPHPKGMKGKSHTKENWDKTRSGWKKWAESNLKRPVLQYDFDGILIAEHASITDAAKSVNGNPSNIKYTIEGRHKHAYNYKWKYK